MHCFEWRASRSDSIARTHLKKCSKYKEQYTKDGISRVLETLLAIDDAILPSVEVVARDLGTTLGVDPSGKRSFGACNMC